MSFKGRVLSMLESASVGKRKNPMKPQQVPHDQTLLNTPFCTGQYGGRTNDLGVISTGLAIHLKRAVPKTCCPLGSVVAFQLKGQ